LRLLFLTGIVICGAVTSGCADRAFAAYSDWSIGTSSQPSLPDGSEMVGHVLERGSTLILEVSLFDPGSWRLIDDESCDRVLVQLPLGEFSRTPTTVRSPVAYYRRCSCAWRLCSEEAAVRGTVLVRERSASGVRARVDLMFPSGELRAAGVFRYGQPAESVLSAATQQ